MSAEEVPTLVEGEMCNFEKMRTLYKIIHDIHTYQETSYPIKIIPEINYKLNNLKLMTDDEAYNKSLTLEARDMS